MRSLLGCGICTLAWIVSCSDQTNATFAPPDVTDAGAVDTDGGLGDVTKGVLVQGTVLGPDGPYEGQVLTSAQGLVVCAKPGEACAADERAKGVARVTADVISAGLVDTHNHILFDIFDDSDWSPLKVYTNHDEWTKEVHYTEMVDVKQCLEDASQGKPSWCPPKYGGAGALKCEMEKWGELKGIVAGTTSIVGLAGSASPCYASLARSIDTQFNGLANDNVQTSALFPPSKATADGVCQNYSNGATNAFVIHCGEGTDAKALAEFTKLGSASTTPGCLYAKGTAITHGTAFTATEFGAMKDKGMKLTWSPASNVALYAATTNVPAALDAGVLVALAPDWSMGGSQNMLDEMRFAKKWSDEHWGARISARDVHTMATVNGAVVLDLANQIGSIKEGLVADLFAVTGDKTAPYDAVLAATPKQVRFTMVGGRLLYGDADLRSIGAGGGTCEAFDSCGAAKFVCAAEPQNKRDKLDQSVAQIKRALDAAFADIDANKPPTAFVFSPVAPIVACK